MHACVILYRVSLWRGVDASGVLEGEDDHGDELNPVQESRAVSLVGAHRRHGHHDRLV